MTKSHRKKLILGIVLSVLAVATGNARAADLSETVDGMAQELIDTGRTAALGIAIDRGGTVLLDKGYGYADVENKVKATPETIYRIGSVTKQFTAVAIVQLQAAGKLQLDDSIAAIITDYPPPQMPISIKNLLQHTSGIPDFTGQQSHWPNVHKEMTQAEMLARFYSLPLEFPPGSKWRYSNSGYFLLGMIIEKVSGKTYGDYLAEQVLVPAGLKSTSYEAPNGSGRAQGYRRNGDALAVAGSISMSQPFAAGALVSTTGDLVRWQRALVEKRMAPADAYERITSDVVRAAKRSEQYGYGLRISTLDGRRVISHGGGIEGFSSSLAYFPESDCTIVLLANTEGFDTKFLLERIADAVFDPAVQQEH